VTGVYTIVKRWWWLLVIGAVVAAFMGYLVANRLPETYEARAQLLVGPLSADKDTLDAAGAQARTYAALATTAPILDATAQRAGLTSVRSKIASVNASDVTRLITITARDGDSVRAAAIANALAGVLVSKAASGVPGGRLSIVERATPPDNPVGPSTGLIVVLTAVVGLLGAFGIAALVDSLTNVMRSEDDLAAFAPVLGSVNGSPAWRRGKPLVVEDDPDSAAAAAYRVLTTKIELSNGEGPLRSLLIVDAHGGHSSARVAANVAAGFAEDGTRVVIIDGDERGRLMGVFTRGAESSDVVQRARPLRIGKLMFDRFRIRRPRLIVLRPRRTAEPIDLEHATEAIEHLLAGADLVLVTAGPPDQAPETLIWARAAQTTVVVAEQDHTKREQMTPTFEGLRIADANVIGAVLS
jgi:capsular polysaccharide biosynthesis protein/Mrp family chromosome partitioning ATPase